MKGRPINTSDLAEKFSRIVCSQGQDAQQSQSYLTKSISTISLLAMDTCGHDLDVTFVNF